MVKHKVQKRPGITSAKWGDLTAHLFLIALSLIVAFPFIWMVTSALKTRDEIWMFPPKLLPQVPQWQNFMEAWHGAPFGQYVFNSVFTAGCIVAIQIINSSMMAYVLTQLKFRGRNLLFALIMGTYMLPVAATYVPSYVILGNLNWLDTYRGLIISNATSVFGIFLMRQAFLQVHRETVEAALLDGAGHWTILWRIFMPISKTTVVTFGLISFVTNYNNYLWPMLITKSENMRLVTQGLRQYFIGGGAYGLNWPQIMAASTFTIAPLLIVFFLAQNWFMKGIGDTGIKG
ncbi:ABC-type sugar transport system, permease component [Desulfosporosinus orientis DSM 765]|uniref:ABC-type sugar transport system, permease component n=1 Tax=Desulfosporosinus orientis (strain ATCC 19365 / DSM 765 / NCIMB 8382 / VKM B-1628 / Singapore I) TaxID=768706 RepID=G7WGB2_DESOD|nr:carbohydrate ABC transporter permease [Desulfosporosinus orientis]AET70844.1 ABC-type sugar transport system, permease component [Desulfosporosinus orientis DSM 765]